MSVPLPPPFAFGVCHLKLQFLFALMIEMCFFNFVFVRDHMDLVAKGFPAPQANVVDEQASVSGRGTWDCSSQVQTVKAGGLLAGDTVLARLRRRLVDLRLDELDRQAPSFLQQVRHQLGPWRKRGPCSCQKPCVCKRASGVDDIEMMNIMVLLSRPCGQENKNWIVIAKIVFEA